MAKKGAVKATAKTETAQAADATVNSEATTSDVQTDGEGVSLPPEDASENATEAAVATEEVEAEEIPEVAPSLCRAVLFHDGVEQRAAVISKIQSETRVQLTVYGDNGLYVKNQMRYSSESKVGYWTYPVIKK